MLNKSWDTILETEYKKDYFKMLGARVKNEYKKGIVYPKYSDIFNAFRFTDYDDVKVVILGQDPYHGDGEAHGLSFSVQDGTKRPPSLQNIFKELYSDLNIARTNNDLTDWANQGVLLLNSVMTVKKDLAASHRKIGWEEFTDNIIKYLNERKSPIVFILWGGFARSKKSMITSQQHLILESVHPSPLSAHNGFFGSKPFSKANAFLKANNIDEIRW